MRPGELNNAACVLAMQRVPVPLAAWQAGSCWHHTTAQRRQQQATACNVPPCCLLSAVPAIPLTMTAGAIFGVVPGTVVVSVAATLACTGAFLIAR